MGKATGVSAAPPASTPEEPLPSPDPPDLTGKGEGRMLAELRERFVWTMWTGPLVKQHSQPRW